MATPMANQVLSHDPLSHRLQSTWNHAVILERLARGGGATRWYFARSADELRDVLDRLRGGSSVSFYFDDQLNVEIDTDSVRQRMFDAVTPAREVVVGYPERACVVLAVELVTGSTELAEVLVHRTEGELVVWGPWPSREGDPRGAITMDLVDADGVLRSHPH